MNVPPQLVRSGRTEPTGSARRSERPKLRARAAAKKVLGTGDRRTFSAGGVGVTGLGVVPAVHERNTGSTSVNRDRLPILS